MGHSSCQGMIRLQSLQLSRSSMVASLGSLCSTATDRRARIPNVRWTGGVPKENVGEGPADDSTERKKREPREANCGEQQRTTYQAWRHEQDTGEYADAPRFCKSATLEESQRYNHVLSPGRHDGAEPQLDGGLPFEDKKVPPTASWRKQKRRRD